MANNLPVDIKPPVDIELPVWGARAAAAAPPIDTRKLATDLFHAMNRRDIPECLRLIEAGADLTIKHSEKTPLISALMLGLSDVAVAIIDKPGVDLNTVYVGLTPLMFASKSNMTSVVDALVRKGADINALGTMARSGIYGVTALWLACNFMSKDSALSLIRAGANVHAGTQMPLSTLFMDSPPMADVKAALIAAGATRRRGRSRRRRATRRRGTRRR